MNLKSNTDKGFIFRLTPLLLLFLTPFDLSLGIFYKTLTKFGSLNPYLIAISFGVTLILQLDYYLQKPDEFRKKYDRSLFLTLCLFLSLSIRFFFRDFQSNDYKEALSVWYDFIQQNGQFAALKSRNFSDYNSTYLYLMAILTYTSIPKLYAIKILSIIFDYLGAFMVFKIVKLKYPKSNIPLFAFCCVIFSPTVILNGSLWAQCDMIYTFFLLWSAHYFLKEEETQFSAQYNRLINLNRYVIVALILWSIALMFKLQAVFFVLPLLFFYIKKKISLFQFTLIFPIIWLLTVLPHWLLGRNLVDILLIYGRQVAKPHTVLTLNAPSIYHLLPDNVPFEMFRNAGIVATLVIIILFAFFFYSKRIESNRQNLIQIFFISVVIIPYFLPKMHERYFFPADVFAIIYAFYFPKFWFLPIMVGGASLFSYFPYLFQTEVIPLEILSLILGLIVCITIKRFIEDNLKSESIH